MQTQRLVKVFVSLFICLLINAILGGLYFSFLGIDSSPEVRQFTLKYYLGHIIYVLLFQVIYGIWFYLFGIYLFHSIYKIFKKRPASFLGYAVWLGFIWGALYTSVLILLRIISPFNITAFPLIEILIYGVTGSVYGWLYNGWIGKDYIPTNPVNINNQNYQSIKMLKVVISTLACTFLVSLPSIFSLLLQLMEPTVVSSSSLSILVIVTLGNNLIICITTTIVFSMLVAKIYHQKNNFNLLFSVGLGILAGIIGMLGVSVIWGIYNSRFNSSFVQIIGYVFTGAIVGAVYGLLHHTWIIKHSNQNIS